MKKFFNLISLPLLTFLCMTLFCVMLNKTDIPLWMTAVVFLTIFFSVFIAGLLMKKNDPILYSLALTAILLLFFLKFCQIKNEDEKITFFLDD